MQQVQSAKSPANDAAPASAAAATLVFVSMTWWRTACALSLETALAPLDLWSLALRSMAAHTPRDECPGSLACALADVSETRDALRATHDDLLRALSR